MSRLIDADAIEYDFNIKTYSENRTIVTSLLADKAKIDAMPTVNQWISTCDYLPEHGEKVVVRFSNGQMSVNLFCRFEEHNYWLPDLPDAIRRPMQLDDLDWWMPIPEWDDDGS